MTTYLIPTDICHLVSNSVPFQRNLPGKSTNYSYNKYNQTKLNVKNCILKSYNSLTMTLWYTSYIRTIWFHIQSFSCIFVIEEILASIRVKSIVWKMLTCQAIETKPWKRTSDGGWKWCPLQIFQMGEILKYTWWTVSPYTKLMRNVPLVPFYQETIRNKTPQLTIFTITRVSQESHFFKTL